MKPFPILTTDRLVLRSFRVEDAARVQEYASAVEIARTTLNIPHPYPDGAAEEWIIKHTEGFESGKEVAFAITLRDGDDGVIGAIAMMVDATHDRAEIGYWIAVPFWNQGYTTEAVGAVIRYGFEDLGLNRIFAAHFVENEASGRVMQKNGMRHEGTQRQHLKKWGKYLDVEGYAILREEWEGRKAQG